MTSRGDLVPDSANTPVPPDQILPSDDRRRVIAEEEFRKRVAQQIDRQLTPPGARLLRLLNAPVTIWALSTIVVGLATWAYQQYTEGREAREQRATLRSRSTNELLFRLSACDRIDSTSNRNDVENILNAMVLAYRSLYQDYKGRSLPDLYLEYCSLGGRCSVPTDTVLAAAAEVRRATWSEIVGQPINHPLRDRSMLPGLRERCSQLQPIRADARATLSDRK
jgi:hypothetical protein